jgi:hypothetical protein
MLTASIFFFLLGGASLIGGYRKLLQSRRNLDKLVHANELRLHLQNRTGWRK